MCAGIQPQVVENMLLTHRPMSASCVVRWAVGWPELPNAPVCAKTAKWQFSVLNSNQSTILDSKQDLWQTSPQQEAQLHLLYS